MPIYLTSASADDANEVVSSGAMTITEQGSTTAGDVSGVNHMGVRFQNVTIANSATIASATLRFPQLSSYTGFGNINTTLYGEKSNTASAFSTSTSNISSRPRTTASVTTIPSTTVWSGAGFDVKNIVQEIVNQGGWSSGNAMAMLFIGSGSGTTFMRPYYWDYFSGLYKAELNITVGSAGGGAPVTLTLMGIGR